MARNEEKLLADFESKMRQLMFFCDTLRSENTSLKREIVQKEETIKTLILKNEQLKKQYSNLRVAKSLTTPDGSEDSNKAKERLTKLVQDVDKCIAMLKS